MPIGTDRPIAVDTRMLASLPTEAVQPVNVQIPPGIQDLTAAFKNGFLTVDDIQKRLADRPVEESNRLFQLQANDFKSRRLDEQEQLAPAEFALKLEEQKLARMKNEAFEKDLNAAAAIRPDTDALKAHLAKLNERKASLEVRKMSPDEKERRDAHKDEANFSLETAYATTFGELPESVTLPSPAKALPIDRWMPVAKEAFVRDQTEQFLATSPQASAEQILAGQVKAAEYFNENASKLYDAYSLEQSQKAGVAYQGTPAYYKELNRQLTERAQNKLVEGAQFDAYKTGLNTAAKTAAEAPTRALEGAAKLRAEVEGSKPIQKFREQQDAAGLVETFATLPQPTNRSDLQLVYATVKLADPGSVVREGEIALSKQADPVLKSLEKKWQGLFSDSDKLLDAADRAELLRISKTVQAQAQANIRPELEKYGNLAAQQGIPLKDILNSREAAILGVATPAPAAAATNPYEALVGKTVVDKKTGRRGVVTKNPDGTYTIK